jgi:hypothetical protein
VKKVTVPVFDWKPIRDDHRIGRVPLGLREGIASGRLSVMDSLPESGGPMPPHLPSSVLMHGTIEEPDEARDLRYGARRHEDITVIRRCILPVQFGSMVVLAFMWLRTGLLPIQAIVILIAGPVPILAFFLWLSLFCARWTRYHLSWDDKGIAIGSSLVASRWFKPWGFGDSRFVAWLSRPRWLKRIDGCRYRWGLFQGFRVIRDSLPDGLATFRVQFRDGFTGGYAAQIYGGTDRWLEFTAHSREIERLVESAQQHVPAGT